MSRDIAVQPSGGRRLRGDGGESMAALVAEHSVDVVDFPKPGIVFKDLSPLFADGRAFATVVDSLVERYGGSSAGDRADRGFDVVAGIEARGFVIAAAVAYAAGVGVVAVRKAGKLPRQTIAASYALEYGEATLEVHADAFTPGQRVLVVDDVLATGGTAEAALGLVGQAGGRLAGFAVLLELAFLAGRERLAASLGSVPVHALLAM